MLANFIDYLTKALFVNVSCHVVVLGHFRGILHDKVFHVDTCRFVCRGLNVGRAEVLRAIAAAARMIIPFTVGRLVHHVHVCLRRRCHCLLTLLLLLLLLGGTWGTLTILPLLLLLLLLNLLLLFSDFLRSNLCTLLNFGYLSCGWLLRLMNNCLLLLAHCLV